MSRSCFLGSAKKLRKKSLQFFSYSTGCFKMRKLENQFRSLAANQLLTGGVIGELQEILI